MNKNSLRIIYFATRQYNRNAVSRNLGYVGLNLSRIVQTNRCFAANLSFNVNISVRPKGPGFQLQPHQLSIVSPSNEEEAVAGWIY
jgi:hypothetical protein